MRFPLALAAACVAALSTGAAAQSGSAGFSGASGSANASSPANAGRGATGAPNSTLRNSGTAGNGATLVPGGGTRSAPVQDFGSSAGAYGGGNGRIRPRVTSENVGRLYPETAASGILTGRPTR